MHHITQRWILAEQIGKKLGITKPQAYTNLSKITDIKDQILADDQEAIKTAKERIGKPDKTNNVANGMQLAISVFKKSQDPDFVKMTFDFVAEWPDEDITGYVRWYIKQFNGDIELARQCIQSVYDILTRKPLS